MLQRELELKHPMLQRHIQLFDRGGTEAAIGIQAMSALEVLDRFDQLPVVGVSVSGKISTLRQVAYESQQTGQTGRAQVWLAGIDRLRNRRKFFAIVGACQFNVPRERMLRSTITCKWRLNLVKDWLQVRSGQDLVA